MAVNTQHEGLASLGNIELSPLDTQDEIGPYVTFVEGVQHDNGVAALFAAGATKPRQPFAGDLASSITTSADFKIHLSEALAAGSAADVRVTRVTNGACASGATEQLLPQAAGSPVLNTDGALLDVTLAAALVEGAQYCVYIGTETMTDQAHNLLTSNDFLGACDTGANAVPGSSFGCDHEPDAVGYDFTSNRDVVLTLTTPRTPVTGLGAATNLTQINASVNAPNDPFFATTNTFLDTVEDGIDSASIDTLVISNLNSAAPESAAAINDLADAINDTLATKAPPFTYDGTVARIRFDQPVPAANKPRAVSYAIVVTDQNGNNKSGLTQIDTMCPDAPPPPAQPPKPACLTLDGNATIFNGSVTLGAPFSDGTPNGSDAITPDAGYTGPIEFFIAGVNPFDTVTIISRGDVDGDNNPDIVDQNAVASIQVLDNAGPYTGINLLARAINGIAGNNGEVTGGGVVLGQNATRPGTPILPVTPQVLDIRDPQDGALTGPCPVGAAPCAHTGQIGYSHDILAGGPDELQFLSDVDLHDAYVADGGVLAGTTISLADATGTAAFFAAAQPTIGVTVTEPLSTTVAQPAPTPTTASVTTFLAHGILNNAFDETEDALGPTDKLRRDYYTMQIDNILNWEDDGAAKRLITFPGLTDADGVVAPTTGGKVPAVQVRDVLPPIMTRAFFDGTNFVFEFDEPIKNGPGAPGTITLLNCGTGIAIGGLTYTGAAKNVTVSSVGPGARDGTRLTIKRTAVAVVDPNTCFDTVDAHGMSYTEDAYSVANLAGVSSLPAGAVDPTPAHGFVDYSDVEDTADNTDVGLPNGNSWDKWHAFGGVLGTDGKPLEADLGLENLQFAIANVVGEFQPAQVARGNKYTTAVGGATPVAGNNTVNVTIAFTQPFFVTDEVKANNGAAGDIDDAFGDDADEAPYGNDDGILANGELLAWGKAKFAFVDSADAACGGGADLTGCPAIGTLTGIQVLDGGGNDILTNVGDQQSAQKIILTFTYAGHVGAAAPDRIAAGDRVIIKPGKGLSSNFILTKTIVPFDDSDAGAENPGDGINSRDELRPIPPLPATYGCPQTNANGGAAEC